LCFEPRQIHIQAATHALRLQAHFAAQAAFAVAGLNPAEACLAARLAVGTQFAQAGNREGAPSHGGIEPERPGLGMAGQMQTIPGVNERFHSDFQPIQAGSGAATQDHLHGLGQLEPLAAPFAQG
jgi:hypothetical protein